MSRAATDPVGTLVGVALILILAGLAMWWSWVEITRDQRKPCPVCGRRVLGVERHLVWAHDGEDMDCCGRVVPADSKALHLRLWHGTPVSGPDERGTP